MFTTKLQTTERRMLRLLVKCRRHTIPQPDGTTQLESWPDYVKRATRTAEHHLDRLNIESWTTTYFKRKWRWASRVATQPLSRWTRRALTWQPELHDKRTRSRPQARPHKRWDDEFNSFLQTIYTDTAGDTTPPPWQELASDATTWSQLERLYIDYATGAVVVNTLIS